LPPPRHRKPTRRFLNPHLEVTAHTDSQTVYIYPSSSTSHGRIRVLLFYGIVFLTAPYPPHLPIRAIFPSATSTTVEGNLEDRYEREPTRLRTYADVIIFVITGSSESSVVFRASLVRQDRDGYASSPEKPPSLRSSQLSKSRPSKSKPPAASSSAFRFRLTRVAKMLNRLPQTPTAILAHHQRRCTGSSCPLMPNAQRARSSSTLRTRSTRSCSQRLVAACGRCP
jgi:hypothetical protein